MDDTGLWLPYPQQLQARIDKKLNQGSRDNYHDESVMIHQLMNESTSVKKISPSDSLCW